ncbi:MAG: hypothetical protein D6689_16650 [Deltaproteobacteria bacterium]|nr:MAG: hypothetical protein D6689_16650 [Deltaproteobacteria bacterium]
MTDERPEDGVPAGGAPAGAGAGRRRVRAGDLDPVPRLPRGRSMRWVWADLFRIAFLAIMLVAVVVLKNDCAEGVSRFIGSFEPPTDAPPAARSPAPAARDPNLPADWQLVPADEVDLRAMFPAAADAGAPAASRTAPADGAAVAAPR